MLVAAGLVLLPATASYASNATAPITVLNQSSSPASSVAAGDVLSVSAPGGLATGIGNASMQISSTWNSDQATVDPESIVAPGGSTVEYTTDGSSWSSTRPEDATTITGVRATGTFPANGISNGEQLLSASGSGTLHSVSTFAGSAGGHGWDAFGDGSYVLNVWHHNTGSYNLDCHYKLDGASCGPVYSVPGYGTSRVSSGSVVGTKVYSMVGSGGDLGVLCTDVSTLPFTSCGFTSLLSGDYNEQDMGSQVMAGTRIYAPTIGDSGAMLCYDTSTHAACTSQPYSMAGLASQDTSAPPAFTATAGGYVFVAATKLFCLNASDGTACTGAWPVGSYADVIGPVPMRNGSGDVVGACVLAPTEECYDLTGVTATFPAALASELTANAVGGNRPWSQETFDATRQYWFTPIDGGTAIACYDWTTSAACTGFSMTASIGDSRYGMTVDDTDPTCVWTNGDNGRISAFNANTGALGCEFGGPLSIIPTPQRLSCAEAGRVRQWTSMVLTAPEGIDVRALRLNVRTHDGVAVPGGSNLVPSSRGVVALSALDVADTGTQPQFEVTVTGGTDNQANDVSAVINYVADPAQLCFNLTVRQNCPQLSAGRSEDPTFPLGDMSLTGEAVITQGETTGTTDLSADVTRADATGCLGTVSGNLHYTYQGGTQNIPNQRVYLIVDDEETIGSTRTDGSGNYSFANVNPGVYSVAADWMAVQTATVTPGATTTANIAVPVTNPFARDVSSQTLQNRATTFGINAWADPNTRINQSSLRLYDAHAHSWVTTLTVNGEGTWTANNAPTLQPNSTPAATLTFTPVMAFTGQTTPVAYRVADGFGTTASAHAQVTVLNAPPTAAPTNANGVRGDTLTVTPNGTGPGVPLDNSSLRLIDPSNGHTVTSLEVDGVGTYTVNTDTGQIAFTPVGTFVGANTVIYRVQDALSRTATSTLTVTLVDITPSAPVTTVFAGQTAYLTVAGVPGNSTVSVPDSVAGSTNVSNLGTAVTVLPNNGFTGMITVPATVTHGSASVITTLVILVRPTPVPSARHGLNSRGVTVVNWHSAPNGTGYRVTANGVTVCTTALSTCTLSTAYGPRSMIKVYTLGGDGLVSTDTTATYQRNQYLRLDTIYFATTSYALAGPEQAKLRRIATTLTQLGFTSVQLVGNTDSQGNAKANLKLSQNRANATKNLLV
ncbi:MAG TPA: OmpA family protein, partial [Rugosimonospora sp.]|nr:OmpA family protein [Rugosimonospora sp.]